MCHRNIILREQFRVYKLEQHWCFYLLSEGLFLIVSGPKAAVNILKVTAITALLLRMKQTLWAAVVFFWMQQPQKRFPRRCYCDIRREGNTHSINNHFTGDRKIIYCVFIVLGRRSRLVHGEKNQHGSFGDALMIFI